MFLDCVSNDACAAGSWSACCRMPPKPAAPPGPLPRIWNFSQCLPCRAAAARSPPSTYTVLPMSRTEISPDRTPPAAVIRMSRARGCRLMDTLPWTVP